MNLLNCSIQKYGWGRRGQESKVAIYKQAQDSSFKLNESEAYAELWMGTHSNGPSRLEQITTANNEPKLLSDYLKENINSTIGERIGDYFYNHQDGLFKQGDLPFLFKVLSINQALSIQAHPNKQLAKQLRLNDPKNYPDSNHKPEMIVAISEKFEAMCGFRPYQEIVANFNNINELIDLCDKENVNRFIQASGQLENAENAESSRKELELILRDCFSSLMNKNNEFIKERHESFLNRLANIENKTYLDNLFLNLAKQYPNDVGCFSIYLLNCITLDKGQAMFLSANVPHAYLFGDGIECMACSDNVVRAGLTPKFKDVKVLCEMLDYSMKSIDENKLNATRTSLSLDKDYLKEFRPNVDEFSVQEIKIEAKHIKNEHDFLIPKSESGSILIVVESSNPVNNYFSIDQSNVKNESRVGLVYFINANTDVHFKVEPLSDDVSDNQVVLLAYRAYCDIKS